MLYQRLIIFMIGYNFSNVQDVATLPKEKKKEQVEVVIFKNDRNNLGSTLVDCLLKQMQKLVSSTVIFLAD